MSRGLGDVYKRQGWVKGQPDGCKDLMRRACDLMEELLRERGL